MEIWKNIPGYEGIYRASSEGNIKSLNYRRQNIEQNLKSSVGMNGYATVMLSNSGTSRAYAVHQLIAMTFLNHKANGRELVVNHINGIRTDNRLSNLEVIRFIDNISKEPKNINSVNNKLKNLNVGEYIDFPIEKMNSIRTNCSVLSITNEMKFKTKQLNELGLIRATKVE